MDLFRKLFGRRNRESNQEQNQSYTQLEQWIIEHNEGTNRSKEILEALCTTALHFPCSNDEGTQPLIVKDSGNTPAIVVCTSAERVRASTTLQSAIKTVKVVPLAQYLHEIASPVALMINPGWKYPFTLPVQTVQQLIDATQIEVVTLDSIIEEFHKGKIVQGEVIKAMLQFKLAIVVQNAESADITGTMAQATRDGKCYNCVFSSEKYTALYKEKYPEYVHDAAAPGSALLNQLPSADGVILNAESKSEMIITPGMIHIAQML
jgi:hypothetical protein